MPGDDVWTGLDKALQLLTNGQSPRDMADAHWIKPSSLSPHCDTNCASPDLYDPERKGEAGVLVYGIEENEFAVRGL
ncbi:hypothetical protein ACFLSG_02100 [Candidatus Bipolaricaulota bacterium]